MDEELPDASDEKQEANLISADTLGKSPEPPSARKYLHKRINNTINHKKFLQHEYLAIYVAVLALFLSQFPPIHTIFRSPSVRVAVGPIASASHTLGNLRMYLPIDISNNGTKTAAIERIECVVKGPNSVSILMPASSYVSVNAPINSDTTRPEIPIGSPIVRPDDRWSELVQCSELPSADEISIIQKMGSDALRHFAITPPPTTPTNGLLVLPEEYYLPAVELFEDKFWLQPGPYSLTVRLIGTDGKILDESSSDFTLSEVDVTRLKGQVDLYKYGFGIAIPMPPQEWVGIKLDKGIG